MGTNVDYVLKVVKRSTKAGDQIVVTINSTKFPEIKTKERCGVEVIGQKLVFKFSEVPNNKKRSFNTINFFSTGYALYVGRFSSKEMIEKMLPFCGEYSEVVYPSSKEQFRAAPQFWINLCQKHNPTNIYKNTSTEVTPAVKPDISTKVKKLVEENSIKSQLINSYKTSNNVDITKLVEKQPAPAKIDLTQLNLAEAMTNQTMFAQYVIDEAHLCTRNMQRKFAALISHRLNKIPLTEEEAIKHYELNKLLVNYIRLQDSVEHLMQQFMEDSGRRYKSNDSEGSV